jgi:hypothetical protein
MRGEPSKAGAADELAVDDLLTRLTAIPNAARSFDVTVAEANRLYPVAAQFLERIRDRGLAEGDGEAGLFERTDLINVELCVGRGAATMSLRRFWTAMLKRAQAPDPVGYVVVYRAACPTPGHPGDCEYSLLLPGGRQEVRAEPSASEQPIAQLRVERRTLWPELPEPVRAIVDELRDLTFVRLPWKLERVLDELEFARRTGLGDCGTATKMLVKLGAERGVPVRKSFGLILAPPFSLRHYWPEVLVDDVWVPIEPLLVKTLVGWNALDGAQWPLYRSPGAALWRIAEEWDVVARHNGELVDVSFRATLAPPAPSLPDEQAYVFVGR